MTIADEPLAATPLPDGLTVQNYPDGLWIVHRWFTPWAIVFIAFSILWDCFVVGWILQTLAKSRGQFDWKLLWGVGHIAAGVVLTWSALATFVNRTFIHVGSEKISVTHKPLWWPGKRSLHLSDVLQLYCKRKISRSKNGDSETFDVYVSTTEGRRVKLVSGLQDSDQALFIEQQIERHLRIADVRIPGQLRK